MQIQSAHHDSTVEISDFSYFDENYEGEAVASRAFAELAWHGMTRTIVGVSEYQRIPCPMKLLLEPNSEFPIFLRKK